MATVSKFFNDNNNSNKQDILGKAYKRVRVKNN